MIQVSTPDTDGRIVHTVQAYNTLIKVADAYKTSVDQILAYNRLQLDWPLQIGQKLIIDPGNFTPSPTPRPLTPIEMLTPESDARYYHTVSSGETLSWISGYYGVTLGELMGWNGLNTSSVIRPGEKLLLMVTPPATETPIPPQPTSTSSPTPVPATHSPTRQTASLTPTATRPAEAPLSVVRTTPGLIILVAALATGLVLVGILTRRRWRGEF